MRRLVGFVILLPVATTSFAIVGTKSTTDPGPADTLWSWVGQVSGSSAVAIGPRTVLTAGHVGAGDFVLDGVTYSAMDSFAGPQLLRPGTTNSYDQVDLMLINLKTSLPGWYDLAPSVSQGDPLTMVGYSKSGVVSPDGNGYWLTTASGVRRAADNTLDAETWVPNYGPTLDSLLKKAGDGVVATHDSGGGFFIDGHLAGVAVFTFNQTDPGTGTGPVYRDYGFGSANTAGYVDPNGLYTLKPGEPYFGSGAIDLTNKDVRDWVRAEAVPEPGTMAAMVAGLAAVAARRRRREAAA